MEDLHARQHAMRLWSRLEISDIASDALLSWIAVAFTSTRSPSVNAAPSILGVVKPEYTARNTSMYFNISQDELGESPALTPPPGVHPNFDHPESRAFAVLVANGIFTALLLIFVALRLYSKISIFQSFDWEDVACIVGSMMSIVYAGLAFHIFHLGFGAHQWNLPLKVFQNDTVVKELKAISFLYDPMTVLAKVSILLLFFRVFATTRRFRIWIYVGIITTTINHGNGFILNLTLCASTSNLHYSRCVHKTRILALVVSTCNILNDFFILLLPLLVISQLKMRNKRKIGLLAVFLTGLGACIMSIIGLIYRISIWHSNDISWNLGPQLIISVVEVNITLIAGCMPLIPMIFRHHRFLNCTREEDAEERVDKNMVPPRRFQIRFSEREQQMVDFEIVLSRLGMKSTVDEEVPRAVNCGIEEVKLQERRHNE